MAHRFWGKRLSPHLFPFWSPTEVTAVTDARPLQSGVLASRTASDPAPYVVCSRGPTPQEWTPLVWLVIVAIVTISVYNVVGQDDRPTKRARISPTPKHCAYCRNALMGKDRKHAAASLAARALFGERPPADEDAVVCRTCFAEGKRRICPTKCAYKGCTCGDLSPSDFNDDGTPKSAKVRLVTAEMRLRDDHATISRTLTHMHAACYKRWHKSHRGPARAPPTTPAPAPARAISPRAAQRPPSTTTPAAAPQTPPPGVRI